MKSLTLPGYRFLLQRRLVMGSICCLALFVSTGTAQVSFRSVGHLPGGTSSQAQALSGDGLVVVGTAGSALGNQAFRWTSAGGMIGLGDLSGGAFDSGASGVSTDGSVVTGTASTTVSPAPGYEAFRWTATAGMVGSGHSSGNTGLGVSANGLVVVGATVTAAGTEAYRWVYGNPVVGLGDLPGGAFSSQASAASADGAVIVGSGNSAAGLEAFRWTSAGGMVGLGDLPGGLTQSLARGVSLDGTVVVGFSNSASGGEAFRWTSAGGMVGLGDLPGGAFSSVGWGVSADGRIVVGSGVSAAGLEAMVWDQANGMRSIRDLLIAGGIDMGGWQLLEARAISPDGSAIVGLGRNPAGNNEGWIATLPVPPTLAQQPSLGLGSIVQATSTVDFQYNVTGTAPVSVQWKKNGTNLGAPVLPDANNIAHHFISSVQPSDMALYTATATNAAGTFNSTPHNTAQYVIDESNWTWRNPRLRVNRAFGFDGKFLMLGTRGFRATSTNGVTWSQQPSLASPSLSGYVFGNGLHVIWGGAYLLTSTDAQNWTSGYTGIWDFPENMVFGNGLFIVVYPSGKIFTSADTKTWTERAVGLVGEADVAFGNGTFVAVNSSGQFSRSTNGVDWTPLASSPVTAPSLYNFANGKFFMGSTTGQLVTSESGEVWTSTGAPFPLGLSDLAYANGQYVAVGDDGTIATSTNGVDWVSRSSGTSAELGSIVFANGVWLAAGNANNTVLISIDNGATWQNQSVATSTLQLNGVATDGVNHMIAVGNGGTILRTLDGVTWSIRDAGATTILNDVTVFGGNYYAVGNAARMVTSNEGTSWTPVVNGLANIAANHLLFVGELNGTLYAAGASGKMIASANGSTWTERTSGTTQQLNGMAYGLVGGATPVYIAVGNSGTILISANTTAWSPVESGTVNALNEVTFANGMFVAVGANGTILRSANGSTWTSHGPVPQLPENFQHVRFLDGQFVVGGNARGVFVSTDGSNWTARYAGNFGASFRSFAVFKNEIFGVGSGGGILSASLTPGIAQQPMSQLVTVGQPAVLRVVAAGTVTPLTYQWKKGGMNIPGAVHATHLISAATLADAGTYTVQIEFTGGNLTSNAATLSVAPVTPSLNIAAHPASMTVVAGQLAAFSVTASGGSLTYQWRRSCVPILGATNSSYSFAAATRADADFYDVVVSNGLTTATSQFARLIVAPTSYPLGLRADTSFAHAYETRAPTVNSVAIQPDGKFLVGGDFSSVDRVPRSRLARFHANGTHDIGFVPPALNRGEVMAIAVQPDGKILVGGTYFAGMVPDRLIRLHADGTPDSTFNGGGSGLNNDVNAIALQPDGKIIIGGAFTTYNGTARSGVARLNNDGTLDLSFGDPAAASVNALVLDGNGRILIGGTFTSVSGVPRSRIARLDANGTLDATFDPGTGANNAVNAVLVQSDGQVVIGGDFSSYNNTSINRIARLAADGSIDSSFVVGTGAAAMVNGLARQSDGKLIVCGSFATFNGVARARLVRLNLDGTVDATFGGSSYNSGAELFVVAVQSDGQVLAGGNFSSIQGASTPSGILRFNSNGTLDVTLAARLLSPAQPRVVQQVSDGKLLVAGGFESVDGATTSFVRLNPNGSIDAAFNSGGLSLSVEAAHVRADGKMVIGGAFTSVSGTSINRIARLNPDLSLDPTFTVGSGSSLQVRRIVPQPDGRLLLIPNGTNFSYNGVGRTALVRILSDGPLDPSFDAGTFDNTVSEAVVQLDGKIVVAGNFTAINGTPRNRLARLNPDGSLDASFNLGTGFNSIVRTVVLQSDGSIIAGGDFGSFNGTPVNRIVRLTSTGSLDSSFQPGFGSGNVFRLLAQEDGRILVATTNLANAIIRLQPNGAVDPTFAVYGLSNRSYVVTPYGLSMLDDGTLLTTYVYSGWERKEYIGLVHLITATAPSIITQPIAQSTTVGGSATFSVVAAGSAPLSYQWIKDGAAIPGATNATLAIANVQAGNVGTYVVQVTNVAQTITSNPASLTIAQTPQTIAFAPLANKILGDPPFALGASATSGLPVSFSVQSGPASISVFNIVTLTGVGDVTIRATQVGNEFYAPAPPVDRTFTVASAAPSIALLSPATAVANGLGFVLTVTGAPFTTGTVVQWNNQPRSTSFISNTEVRATIPASDLVTTQDLLLVPITVANGSGNVSVPKVFTVRHASMGELDASFVPAGATGLASTAPTATGQAGLSVVAENVGGGPLLIAAGTYDGIPPSGLVFNSGGIYYDIKLSGADAADSLSVNFYYPSTLTGSNELRLRLTYYNGTTWLPVRSSGNGNPLKDTTDNLDSTTSGGRFTVVLDTTSTPKITELNGTVFALVDTGPMIAITASSLPIPVNTVATIGISYQAIGTPATQQLSVAWGDGSTTPAASTTSGNTTATHLYNVPGVYTILATVTDVFGDSDSDEYNYITVYDPNAGFVTGAGWINSPAGAYRPQPTLTGKAHFGFVSRYQNGANVPTGQTQFTFQLGDLRFHSTDYDWLVVAGARAQFKGSGKINGAGNYGFLLTATDGAGPGGGGVDSFRIKIWDKAILTGDNIVYDNVHGSPDDINASGQQALGGGSITIQRR